MTARDVIVDLLQRGHAVQFRVRGDSMHPVIREDDLLHVEPCTSFSVGDVVLTLAERGLTAHRVIARVGERVVTRGDNAPGVDPEIEVSRVLGIVRHVERDGRRLGVRRRIAAAFRQHLKRRLASPHS
ncbi:MAG: S24/S26 family peptidase [Thermoanaerobaculia bacterium]